MKNRNISIYKLSQMTNIDDRGLGKIVNGKTKNPHIDTLIKIAKAFNLTNDEFAELCGYKNDNQTWNKFHLLKGMINSVNENNKLEKK